MYRNLGRRIARFDWSAVEHDVLKVLYESVITKNVREKLGEYYTPDWLADRMVYTFIPAPLTSIFRAGGVRRCCAAEIVER